MDYKPRAEAMCITAEDYCLEPENGVIYTVTDNDVYNIKDITKKFKAKLRKSYKTFEPIQFLKRDYRYAIRVKVDGGKVKDIKGTWSLGQADEVTVEDPSDPMEV